MVTEPGSRNHSGLPLATGSAGSNADYLDLNNLQFAKWIGLYDARRGTSYVPPANLSADGLLDAAIRRYYDLNPYLPRPASRRAA